MRIELPLECLPHVAIRPGAMNGSPVRTWLTWMRIELPLECPTSQRRDVDTPASSQRVIPVRALRDDPTYAMKPHEWAPNMMGTPGYFEGEAFIVWRSFCSSSGPQYLQSSWRKTEV